MKFPDKLKIQICLLLLVLSFAQCGTNTSGQKAAMTEFRWSTAMAQSEMKRNPSAWMIDFQKKPKWAYVNGLVCQAILQVWEATGEEQYFKYARGYADSLIDQNGQIKGYKQSDFNLDKLNSGKMLFTLYKETKDEKYRKAIETLWEQIRNQPRTPEGGFWHKKIYPNQMWLDGIYMGTPFYAQYAQTFGDSTVFDDIALQFTLLRDHARDTASGWFYHGWDASKSVFWADPETGLSKNFWGRGVGWYYMALVDVLEYFPPDHPKRKVLLESYQKLTDTIVQNRDPQTGLWYQVLDKPNREGNYIEATCSTMFTYGMVKGVLKGYLNSSYLKPSQKAYQDLLDYLVVKHPDGEIELKACCAGAGLGPADNPVRDGTYEYYINEDIRSNDGKGTGPFIMVSLMIENSDLFN